MSQDCLFCRIARRELPSRVVFEDDDMMAFHDLHPAAPVHFLMIPKQHFDNLYHTGPDEQALLGKMMLQAPRLARQEGLTDGFRLIINNGRAGRQEVYHLHLHVLGGAVPLTSPLSAS